MKHDSSQWRRLAQQLRVDSIRCSTAAGSGHPTSAMSAADLMAVLLIKYLRYDFAAPDNPANDRLVFSKGHASPLLYSMYKAAGVIEDQELMTFRKLGSRLQGHPTPAIPWVDVATGSLGQGLPIAVGMALAGKYVDRVPNRIWVLTGDSELAEGSMWEALQHGAHYKLDNLTAIADINRLGQRGPTMLEWDCEGYARRAQAFGWHAIQVDGHDPDLIDKAFAEACAHSGQPTLVIARTLKGRGVATIENKEGWHGKTLNKDEAAAAIRELGGESSLLVSVGKPPASARPASKPSSASRAKLPTYEVGGTAVATRKAYGDALKALGEARSDVVVLDAEVSNSTFAEEFAKAYPDRFFEMYIAEQQMVAAAVGLSVLGKVAFASSFAAFLTRAYDFIRMAAVSGADLRLCGSHAGVSIGEDGPSQMALEDMAMMRAVVGSTVLYPCDPNQTAQLVELMAELPGISFLRTTREKTPVLYAATERFKIGGSRVLRRSDSDRVTVVAAGITVHQAVKACDRLQSEGVSVRLIDAYSVKPIDRSSLVEATKATQGRIVIAEDHWPEGGLGSAVLEALAREPVATLRCVHLAVQGLPGSGTPQELMDAAGIGTDAIVKAVRRLA